MPDKKKRIALYLDSEQMELETVELANGDKALRVRGIALTEGEWNRIWFSAEEIEKGVAKLCPENVCRRMQLRANHSQSVWDVVGLVHKFDYDPYIKTKSGVKPGVWYEAELRLKEAVERVNKGLWGPVSVGVYGDLHREKIAEADPENKKEAQYRLSARNLDFEHLAWVTRAGCDDAGMTEILNEYQSHLGDDAYWADSGAGEGKTNLTGNQINDNQIGIGNWDWDVTNDRDNIYVTTTIPMESDLTMKEDEYENKPEEVDNEESVENMAEEIEKQPEKVELGEAGEVLETENGAEAVVEAEAEVEAETASEVDPEVERLRTMVSEYEKVIADLREALSKQNESARSAILEQIRERNEATEKAEAGTTIPEVIVEAIKEVDEQVIEDVAAPIEEVQADTATETTETVAGAEVSNINASNASATSNDDIVEQILTLDPNLKPEDLSGVDRKSLDVLLNYLSRATENDSVEGKGVVTEPEPETEVHTLAELTQPDAIKVLRQHKGDNWILQQIMRRFLIDGKSQRIDWKASI